MEGIIKYNVDWDNSEHISELEYKFINPYRAIAFKNNYIGVGNDNIGFGNISFRTSQNGEFVISGSATGHIELLEKSDYAKVLKFNIEENYIKCVGGRIASSESLSHAAIYSANKRVSAVLHLHSSYIWNKYINKLPTTSDAEYGTPQMALSISGIVKDKKENGGTIVMQNHKDGIIVYSDRIEKLFHIISNYLDKKGF